MSHNSLRLRARQPTALYWCVASLIGFLISIAFAVLFVRSPKTIVSGLTMPFYFLLLVVLGCSAALLLFGALRGYAKYTGNALQGKLEIGGPIVVACLTVYGGYLFRPEGSGTLVVRVHDAANSAVICPETVQLVFGQEVESGEIGSGSCQAQFNEIPSNFLHNSSFEVRVTADGYQTTGAHQYPISSDGVIVVSMQKVLEHCRTWGRLVSLNPTRVIAGAEILINGDSMGTTDNGGNFAFDVPLRKGSQVTVTARRGGREIFNGTLTLPISSDVAVNE